LGGLVLRRSGKLPANMREDLEQTDEAAAAFLRGAVPRRPRKQLMRRF